ncbi:MAG: DUF3857 domain-containing protein [Deltaproteobacteria bacterium]|nr:MAG: DUF3857 domain-containing protein [Deltaproteobacteria bacterium]
MRALTPFSRLAATLGLLVLGLLVQTGCLPAEFKMKRPPASPSAKDYPKDSSVYLLRKTKIRISDDGYSYEENTHHQIKVLTKRSAGMMRRVYIPYNNGLETVSKFAARIVRPGGKWKSYAVRTSDVPFSRMYASRNFSSRRWKAASLMFPTVNSVVEYRYTKNGNSWSLYPRRLQSGLPVKRSVYQVSVPSGVKMRSKVFDGVGFPGSRVKYTKTTDPDDASRELHIWEAVNVPALKTNEPNTYSWVSLPLRVQNVFGTYRLRKYEGQGKTWNDIAAFYTKLVEDRDQPSDTVKKFTEELVKDAKANTQEEKIRTIYKFVNDKIRYISVGIGLGGWQPQSAEFTLTQRYGDCKAKATLFKAMLAVVGVKAQHVLVRTRQLGRIDPNFPADYAVFNHVVTYLPGYQGGKLFDTTNVGTHFGYLPGGDSGASMLIVDGNKGTFKVNGFPSAEDNVNHNRYVFTRYKKRIEAEWTHHMTGSYRLGLMEKLRKGKLAKADAQKKWAKGQIMGLVRRMGKSVRLGVNPKKLEITSVSLNDDKAKKAVTVKIAFKVPTRKTKNRVVYVPMQWSQTGNASTAILKERKRFDVFGGLQVGKHINEVIFKRWEPVEVPENASVNNTYVKYQLACEKKDQYISYRRDILFSKPDIALADHASFRKAFEQVREADRRILILRKGYGDKDKDGVKDNVDKCPLTPGPAKYDGCPDRDGDGIIDKLDACPDVKGVANEDKTKNGCPKIVLVKVTKTEIKILQKIFFRFGRANIRRKSFKVLDQVAEVLNSRKEIRVRIEGHTDNVGRKRSNLRLSKRRAASVRRYLVKKGVDEKRLDSEGYGMSKPLVPNTSRKNRAKNRRVQFSILKKDDEKKDDKK